MDIRISFARHSPCNPSVQSGLQCHVKNLVVPAQSGLQCQHKHSVMSAQAVAHNEEKVKTCQHKHSVVPAQGTLY